MDTGKIIVHKDWVIRVIQSCETPEQFDAAKLIVDNFTQRLTMSEVPAQTMRDIQNDILEALITKEGQKFM